MFESEEITKTMHAIMTGFPDRAINIVETSTNLDEDEREILRKAIADPPSDTGVLGAIGDALRVAQADKIVVNEVYRAAFYNSDAWQSLVDDPFFAFFSANKAGHVLDKWIHYFPIYTRHLAPFAARPVSVLEIGVYRGGSMRMWSRFFGPDARLVGVDIDPVAVIAAGDRYTVVIADQADPDAMRKVAEEHGPFDVIIDDGGHSMVQQITSIETLFPMLNEGGVYLVEDCHTSYWDEYDGGRGREGTFIEWVKTRLDDLHGYHQKDAVDPVWTRQVDGIHVYDSVVVLDKQTRFAPFAEQNGGADFVYTSRLHSSISSELVATRQAALDERDHAVTTVAELVPRLASAESALASAESALDDSRSHIHEMRNTLSWRVTAPLRRLRRWR